MCDTLIALFDVGSNSLKADLFCGSSVIQSRRQVTGLGLGLVERGALDSEGKQAVFDSAADWIEEWRKEGPCRVLFAGTEAVRRASDGKSFLEALAQRFEAEWLILADGDEGRLGFEAWALEQGEDWMMADLGGRSCEFTTKSDTFSAKRGVLTAREALEKLDFWAVVDDLYQTLPPFEGPFVLAGGAGTVMAALMDCTLFTEPEVRAFKARMEGLTPQQRKALKAMPQGWEPNLFGALAWIFACLRRFGPFICTELGWRHGLALRLQKKDAL